MQKFYSFSIHLRKVSNEVKSVRVSSWRKYPDTPLGEVVVSDLELRQLAGINETVKRTLMNSLDFQRFITKRLSVLKEDSTLNLMTLARLIQRRRLTERLQLPESIVVSINDVVILSLKLSNKRR